MVVAVVSSHLHQLQRGPVRSGPRLPLHDRLRLSQHLCRLVCHDGDKDGGDVDVDDEENECYGGGGGEFGGDGHVFHRCWSVYDDDVDDCDDDDDDDDTEAEEQKKIDTDNSAVSGGGGGVLGPTSATTWPYPVWPSPSST